MNNDLGFIDMRKTIEGKGVMDQISEQDEHS